MRSQEPLPITLVARSEAGGSEGDYEAMSSEVDHEHDWVYKGIVFSHSKTPMSGTGAHARYYAEAFYCRRCLEAQYKNLDSHDQSSYSKVLYNASPRP